MICIFLKARNERTFFYLTLSAPIRQSRYKSHCQAIDMSNHFACLPEFEHVARGTSKTAASSFKRIGLQACLSGTSLLSGFRYEILWHTSHCSFRVWISANVSGQICLLDSDWTPWYSHQTNIRCLPCESWLQGVRANIVWVRSTFLAWGPIHV